MRLLRRLITCDVNKCTGCRICELACSEIKERIYNPMKSRIRVVTLEPLINIALNCRFCEKPPCVTSCPRAALKQKNGSKTIQVDPTKCNGCKWCLNACGFGALTLHPDNGKIIVCDLCEDHDEPECIKACPFNALELVYANILSQKARLAVIKKLF